MLCILLLHNNNTKLNTTVLCVWFFLIPFEKNLNIIFVFVIILVPVVPHATVLARHWGEPDKILKIVNGLLKKRIRTIFTVLQLNTADEKLSNTTPCKYIDYIFRSWTIKKIFIFFFFSRFFSTSPTHTVKNCNNCVEF